MKKREIPSATFTRCEEREREREREREKKRKSAPHAFYMRERFCQYRCCDRKWLLEDTI